jgi:ABC-type glycerol-3-phosphate transport system substrate-binding protein
MKTIAIALMAAAAALAGCAASSPEQATAPAAGLPPLTYPAHNMGEFEAARTEADDYCYKKNDLKRAAYASRTFETASFECASK